MYGILYIFVCTKKNLYCTQENNLILKTLKLSYRDFVLYTVGQKTSRISFMFKAKLNHPLLLAAEKTALKLFWDAYHCFIITSDALITWTAPSGCCFESVRSPRHYQPFPFQVGEPFEVIGYDVVILASWTRDYDDTFVVSQLRDLLHGSGGANLRTGHSLRVIYMTLKEKVNKNYLNTVCVRYLARVNEVIVCWLNLSQCLTADIPWNWESSVTTETRCAPVSGWQKTKTYVVLWKEQPCPACPGCGWTVSHSTESAQNWTVTVRPKRAADRSRSARRITECQTLL